MTNKKNKNSWVSKVIIILIVLGIVGVVYFEEEIFHSNRNAFESTLNEHYSIQIDKKEFTELDLKVNDDEMIGIRSNVPIPNLTPYTSSSVSCDITIYNILKESSFVFSKIIMAINYDLIIYQNNLYVKKTTQEQVSKNAFLKYINTCIEDENASLVRREQLKSTWKKD